MATSTSLTSADSASTNSASTNPASTNSASTNSASTNSASTNSARKRKRKDKKRGNVKSTEDASTTPTPLTDGAFGKRRNNLGKTARDPHDEPAAKKPKLSQTSPGPIIDVDGLSWPSKGTRSRIDEKPEEAEKRLDKMRGAVRTLLGCVGEDPNREGLLATPSRYAEALLFLTKGYQVNVMNIVNNALFHEGHNEMVIVKDIEIYSLCEHHLVPFTGKVYLIRIRIPSPTRS